MKNTLLHFLLIFSLFNQSIDFDYAVDHTASISREYDDIDSIWELILEGITGDGHLVSENDDDSGIPGNKDVNKDGSGFQFYHETNNMLPAFVSVQLNEMLLTADNNITCKGYLFIVSPPPDSLY